MPYAADRSARLFYDDSCGPCRFAARTTEAVSRHRVVAIPLAAQEADQVLGRLSEEDRFGAAHLAVDGELNSAEALTVPLVGLAFGPTWGRVVQNVPFLRLSLGRTYRRLWEYRRTRGCGARASSRPDVR